MGIDSIAGSDGGVVYVLMFSEDVDAGDTLSAVNASPQAIPSTDLDRGAVSFSSSAEATIFLTAENLTFSTQAAAGTMLTTTMLRQGTGRALRENIDPSTYQPETLSELLDLQTQEPFAIKMINLDVSNPAIDVEASIPLVGAAPMEGDTMDLWVETGRTSGPFAAITLRRFVTGIAVQRVVDPELVLAAMQRSEQAAGRELSGATPPSTAQEPEDQRGIFYWANITRTGGLALEEAKQEGRLIFAMSSRTPVSDFLGNGVMCRADYCTISVDASEDLKYVRAAIDRFQGDDVMVEEGEDIRPDPFSIMDGVSVELENRLHQAGYTTFEQVAGWQEAQMTGLESSLGISRMMVLYIRQQASVIANASEDARQQLSIATAPTE